MIKTYGYVELFQLLEMDSCDERALSGFLIKPDGIWIDELTDWDRKNLHPNELAAILGPFTTHDTTKPVLSLPCTGEELKHFLVETGLYCGEDIEIDDKPGQHRIKPEERRPKGKSAVQVAIESFLNDHPTGTKNEFYKFLKERIKLPKGRDLKDGQSYEYYFQKVIEKGNIEGVYLNHAKEGKTEGDSGWNRYSGGAVSSLISKEKKRRKNT